jgi:hypothetical protein
MGCLLEMELKKVMEVVLERGYMLEAHGVVKHDLPRNLQKQ